MKKLLLLLAAFTGYSTMAQYQVTTANVPVINDVNITATDTMPNESITAGMSGTGQTYNVADVDLDIESSIFFEDPANSPEAAMEFPEAEVSFDFGLGQVYAVSRNDRFNIIGIEVVNPADGSTQNERWDNPLSLLRFPYGFGDSYQDTGHFRSTFAIDQNFMGVQIDSGRIDVTIEVDALVDGAGEFNGINGTFQNVIRERQEVTTITVIEICVSFLPGFPCEFQDASDFGFGGGTEKTVEYYYYGPQNKFPYAQLTYNEAEDTLQEVIINIDDFEPNSITEVKKLGNKVYPNPATNVLYVNSNSTAIVTVMDLSGRTLINTVGNKSINIESLKKGAYIITIKEDNVVYSGQLLKQ